MLLGLELPSLGVVSWADPTPPLLSLFCVQLRLSQDPAADGTKKLAPFGAHQVELKGSQLQPDRGAADATA